jgi:3-isopropylmalate/(R)-2-methylmalate dehydratase small subunit
LEKFTKLTSIVAPLDRANVDTDQIIPKQFLKRIERTGFGEFAFFDWRYLGSGSSREHAPWALMEMGYKAIIATSFADIFRNNCMQNGLLPVILSESEVDTIMARALRGSGYKVTVDLDTQTVTDDQGLSAKFDVDPFRKNSLLEGLDDVGITMSLGEAIDSFEEKRTARW